MLTVSVAQAKGNKSLPSIDAQPSLLSSLSLLAIFVAIWTLYGAIPLSCLSGPRLSTVFAVPVMAMMMLIVTNRAAMGRFRARPSLARAGWGATALMGITVAALLWSLLP